MALVGSSIVSTGSTTISYPTTPTIENLELTTADTEYDYALPANTRKFLVQNRNDGLVKLAFISGESDVTYLTLFPGCPYWEDNVSAGSVTLYLQSPKASQTLEIVSWA